MDDHRLDSVTAQDFHDRLDAAVESAERVVVDMAGLTCISSAGLRVIMQAGPQDPAAERQPIPVRSVGRGARGVPDQRL